MTADITEKSEISEVQAKAATIKKDELIKQLMPIDPIATPTPQMAPAAPLPVHESNPIQALPPPVVHDVIPGTRSKAAVLAAAASSAEDAAEDLKEQMDLLQPDSPPAELPRSPAEPPKPNDPP